MKEKLSDVKVYVDGGCRGNPGSCAIGVVITDTESNTITQFSEVIGDGTNHQADYRALIRGLEVAAEYTEQTVNCFCDSELVIRQLKGEYQVKNAALQALLFDARIQEESFESVVYRHVNRTNKHIQRADKLLNIALDNKLNRQQECRGLESAEATTIADNKMQQPQK